MTVIFDDSYNDTIYTTMKIPFSLINSDGVYVCPGTSYFSLAIYIDDTSITLNQNQYSLTRNDDRSDYLLEIKPDNIPFNEYLRVYVNPGSASFIPKRFTILQLNKPLSEEITVASDATTINIPFHLLWKGTWEDVDDAIISSFLVYVYPDGENYIPDPTHPTDPNNISSSYYTITHMDQGDYNLALDYSDLCTELEAANYTVNDYLRIAIYYDNAYYTCCFTIRKAVAASSNSGASSGSLSLTANDISSIASGVWNFGNSSGTSLVTRTLSASPSLSLSSSDLSSIASAVWSYTVSSSNVIGYISESVWNYTNRALTQSITVYTDNSAIATAVWNYGNSGTSIGTRTLSTSPSSLTAADVWNYGNSSGTTITTRTLTSGSSGSSSNSGTVTIDTGAIAQAVWEYNGDRELTTDVSVDFDTDDIAEAVWGSIKDNNGLTALGESLVATIATTVWTNTDRSLTTAMLDDGELVSDEILTLGNISQADVALSADGLAAVTAGVWDETVRSLTTNVIGNNSANYLAIKSDIAGLQAHGDSDWATPNDYATTSDISDLQDHGDAEWAIPDDYATTDDLADLSTFDAANDTVLLSVEQQQDLAAYIVDGLATPSDIPVSDITAIKNKVDTLSNANLSTVTSAISAATSTLSNLITALDKPAAITTASVNAIKEGLATATNVSDAKSDILDSVSAVSSSLSDISTVVEALPSASSVATAVWSSENKTAFAEELLSTDVISLPVETNGFTLTHMILASQNSTVEQAPNTTDDHTAVWKIRGLDSNEEPVIIATRTLMLNNYGAIVGTSTPVESTDISEEPEETP